eukprot:Ihof_evm21s32 gene=Ihof_evmTU21s32
MGVVGLVRFVNGLMAKGVRVGPIILCEGLTRRGITTTSIGRIVLGDVSKELSYPTNPSLVPSGRIVLGDVSKELSYPTNPSLVPSGYIKKDQSSYTPGSITLCQEVLGHLRWMVQKDTLGQDMFLIGPPGPMKRHIAMAFCE